MRGAQVAGYYQTVIFVTGTGMQVLLNGCILENMYVYFKAEKNQTLHL
jgi:hypothetical protein